MKIVPCIRIIFDTTNQCLLGKKIIYTFFYAFILLTQEEAFLEKSVENFNVGLKVGASIAHSKVQKILFRLKGKTVQHNLASALEL